MIDYETMEGSIKPIKIALLPFFPLIWFASWIGMLMTPPIYRPGLHVITNDTGSGKSMLAHVISKRWDRKGWIVRSNSKFNSTVSTLRLTYYWDNFVQKRTLKNCIPIFDEIQRDFNKRMNRANEYNEVFIPFIEWLATHRHQNCPAVYFITQNPNRLDTQLFDLMANFHFVDAKKRPSIKAWLRTGTLRPVIAPFKINYTTRKRRQLNIQSGKIVDDNAVLYKTKYSRKGELKRRKIKPWSVTITPDLLCDFDTYAFRNDNILSKPEKTPKKAATVKTVA